MGRETCAKQRTIRVELEGLAVLGRVHEHRGLDVISGVQPLWTTGTARFQLRTLIDAFLDEILDLVVLHF